ncbi:THUMP-like domain-containing protein [Dermabacteraceae bacterium P7006]
MTQDAFLENLQYVLQPEGWQLLNSLPPYSEDGALALNEKLRREGHPAGAVAALLTQSRLRARAADKFGEFAQRMLFTPDGLEQATRLSVAAHHAQRYAALSPQRVVDLGCGLGGDSLAFAGMGLNVLAIDRDPVTASLASINLMPFPSARAEAGDFHAYVPTAGDALWLDPARRENGRRLYDPEECSPPLSQVLELARRLGSDGAYGPVGVKLGPGIDHAALPDDCETQWVSVRGSVVEAALWCGPLARPGVRRSALLLGPGGTHRLDGTGEDSEVPVGEVGPYLYEPDGAVIRSGLLGTLAAALDLHVIDQSIAYLSGAAAQESPFLTGYRVRDVLPFGVKALKAYLRKERIGNLVIKKRGAALEPEQLRRMLRPAQNGDGRATIFLTRVAGKHSVIVAEPLKNTEAEPLKGTEAEPLKNTEAEPL